jgi:hypothetical protein
VKEHDMVAPGAVEHPAPHLCGIGGNLRRGIGVIFVFAMFPRQQNRISRCSSAIASGFAGGVVPR